MTAKDPSPRQVDLTVDTRLPEAHAALGAAAVAADEQGDAGRAAFWLREAIKHATEGR